MTQRRLAAIVFTDMVGYTTLSQRDEALAIKLLDAHNSIVRGVLNQYNGREVKTIGDSFLLEFSSALDAVRFAVDIQDEFRKFNSTAPSGERVSVRIGVHVGDVVSRAGDLFGDAVNIASRIVRATEGGRICVSRDVYDQVRNKVQFGFEKLPPQQLKNVQVEVELYRIVPPWEPQPESRATTSNRIAVIPFTNISPDSGDNYFADGLTEELISVLSKISGLRVIARTSVNHYKDSGKGAKQIGYELGVSHLLEGSVRKAGSRIRIAAHLVDAESQEEVWSDTYEKNLVDVFSIQSDIAARVADSLRIRLLSAEKTKMKAKETDNIAAYVAYLKGRSLLREGTEKAVHSAREQFELAIREDKNYAKAYAGMADSHMLLGDYLFSPIPIALEEATRCVNTALSLDPNLAEARVSLASLLMYDYRFDMAEREFRKAIEANPSYATGHHWYSVCLLTFGRQDQALDEMSEAEELDPLSASITISTIYRLIGSGKDDEIKKRIRKLEEMEPNSPLVDEARMAYSFVRKDWDAALVYLNRMIEQDPSDPYLDSDLAYIYAVRGRRGDALKLVEKLKKVPEDVRVKGQLLAFAYLGLGDLDSAFEWLNYAVSKKEFFIGWVRGYPLFEPVRSDPRFKELLRAANLPVP